MKPISPWSSGAILIALLLSLPLLTIVGFLFSPSGGVWSHLVDTVLDEYVTNSLWLMLGVGTGAAVLGISGAWLTTMCQFPGRRVFEWALLLPMALPGYIIAYTYTGLLDVAGPVQSGLRELFDWGFADYWFPNIRSLGGAITMLALVLYPYVYLLTRAAFLEQSMCVLEVSRSLGRGPWNTFFRVALPLARPAAAAGLALVLMETLADFGTVQYFGVQTFTTGIFRTWFGLGEVAAAAQLSALLLGAVFLLLALERWSRRKARYHQSGNRHGALARYPLRGWKAAGAFVACLAPLLFGFLIPAAQLVVWSWERLDTLMDEAFLRLLGNSIGLALAAALLAVAIALFMAYAKRLHPSPGARASVRAASMGYAIPGAVIAVGVMIPLAWLDNTIDGWLRHHFDISTGLLLSGTLFALLFGYLVRFLAVAINGIEAGLLKIRPSQEQAARSLGLGPGEVLRRVHLPLLRGSLFTALLLVFVDVLKELPATLILRPFNFNTLAVRAYELASDERLADAAPPALAILVAGLIPILILSLSISRSRESQNVTT
jgi:iron(III) transport system permease protein